MNRKMRAAAANKSARETREAQGASSRPRHQVGTALFVTRDEEPLGLARVHLDHEEKTLEILPDQSEMN